MNTRELAYLERWEKEQASRAQQMNDSVEDVEQKAVCTIDDIRNATSDYRPRRHVFSKDPERIVRRYRMHCYRLGYPPSLQMVINGDRWMPTQTTIRKYFQSANKFLKAAGFKEYRFKRGIITAIPEQKTPLTELQRRCLEEQRSVIRVEKSHETAKYYQPDTSERLALEQQQLEIEAEMLANAELHKVISQVAHRQEDVAAKDSWCQLLKWAIYRKNRDKVEYWHQMRELEDKINAEKARASVAQKALEKTVNHRKITTLRENLATMRVRIYSWQEKLELMRREFTKRLEDHNNAINQCARSARVRLALQYKQKESKHLDEASKSS